MVVEAPTRRAIDATEWAATGAGLQLGRVAAFGQ